MNKIILKIIGDNLRHLRYVSNLTQMDLALLFNFSRSTYAAYENGTQIPSIFTLIQISNFYDISIDMLLDENLTSILSDEIY